MNRRVFLGAGLLTAGSLVVGEKEDLIEGKRREIFRISAELSALRNMQSRLQSSLEGLKHREESSVRDSENLKNALTDIDFSLKDIESNLLEKNNNIFLLNEKKGIKTNEITSNKSRVENLRETLTRLKEALASDTSRIEYLKEVVFDESVREFLSGDLNFSLIGSISDVIEIDDEYEKAIESVLSEKVNSFILPSFNDIDIAISLLKKKGLGRTAFIPVNPAAGNEQISVPEGCLGRAIDFIHVKEEFSQVVRTLFENSFFTQSVVCQEIAGIGTQKLRKLQENDAMAYKLILSEPVSDLSTVVAKLSSVMRRQ